jgi:hypothetical protein
MASAVELLESLIEGSRSNYSDFAVTQTGKPYRDALYSFCTGDEDLEIPELGINFSVLNARKHVTDNYEGKTFYDLSVSFKDNATGKLYSIVSEVYKGMDASYRNILVSEQEAREPAKPKKRKPKVLAIPADQAQALVDKLGTFFSAQGREVYVDSTRAEGDAFAHAIHSPDVDDEFAVGAYRFVVKDFGEEVTSESDAWSLGEGSLVLRETTLGVDVCVNTSLFLGQDTEITGVTISCQKAAFELHAE